MLYLLYKTKCAVATVLGITRRCIYMHYRENISSRFSRNSEADASEFQENLEEMIICSC